MTFMLVDAHAMNRKVTVVFYLLINISYTIFCLFRHVQTVIMMAAMDPKPVKLQENVILTFKNLKVSTKAKLYSVGSVLISFNFNKCRFS